MTVRVRHFSMITLLLLAAACRKEPEPARWDLDISVPLVHGRLTLGDLVPDSLLVADGDGRLSLRYTSTLFALSLDTVLTAPDTSLWYTYVLPIPGPLSFPPGATFNSLDNVTRFDLEDLELRHLRIRSGELQVAITSMINGDLIGNFSLPGATLNGAPFAVQQQVPAGLQLLPATVSATRSLAGYTFDLRGPDLADVNTLATQLSYMTDPAGGPVSVTSADSLKARVSYLDIVPDYAKGYFGSRAIAVAPSSTTMDLFEGISGLLDLSEVEARLRVRNGLGVDARATISELRAMNSASGAWVDLQAPITNGPLNLDRALDLGHGFQEAQNTWTLNNGNSNITAFVELLPDRIDYALDLTLNPLGDVSNGNDFLYYDSRITGDLEIDIPLRLSATDLTLARTLTVDLPGSTEQHAIRSGTLHLFAENGFPFQAAIGLAIVDATDQVRYQLPEVGPIAAAGVDGDGMAVGTQSSHLQFLLDESAMDLLHTTGRLRVTAVFNTAGAPAHVTLLSGQGIDLRISVQAHYLVNGDD